MSPEEYRRRIAQVERYCDERMFAHDYRERWFPPDALFVMHFLLEVIEADVYDEPRPAIDDVRPWMRERLTSTLSHFNTLWSR